MVALVSRYHHEYAAIFRVGAMGPTIVGLCCTRERVAAWRQTDRCAPRLSPDHHVGWCPSVVAAGSDIQIFNAGKSIKQLSGYFDQKGYQMSSDERRLAAIADCIDPVQSRSEKQHAQFLTHALDRLQKNDLAVRAGAGGEPQRFA